jgi:plastocyanin
MKRSAVIFIVIAIIIVVAGAFLLSRGSKTSNLYGTSPSPSASAAASGSPTASTSAPASATITYSSSGFSPAIVTVRKGGTLTVKNTTSSTMQFDSNPHPVHTDDPELNIGSIAGGGSATITVTKTGSHGYHNHLDPSQTGTLVVE